MNNGITDEFKMCELGDKRLNKRLIKTAETLFDKIGSSIPMASGSWTDTKAIYRFLDHQKFTENKIIEGHLQETANRFKNHNSRVLVLHDTTELTYHRTTNCIGKLKRVFVKQRIQDQKVTIQGLLFHTSLVVTLEGLPIEISAIKLWTRKKFKGTRELKSHINPTRVPIEEKESYRWIENIRQTNKLLDPSQCIHVGDREADIYELYSECQNSKASFVIRLDVNRRINDSKQKLFECIKEEPAKGSYTVILQDSNDGKKESVEVEVRFKMVNVLPPIGKQKKYSDPIVGYYIEAKEKVNPADNSTRPRIEWKLLTNVQVSTFENAYEKIQWYASRWKIETFFKILKSGCKTEQSKLRSAERLAKFITLCSVIAWKVFWLTMLNRSNPKSDINLVLNDIECKVVKEYQNAKGVSWKDKTLSDYVITIAKLGGYLNRKSDPPPGNMVLWRGMSRFNDIIMGFKIARKLMGN